MVPRRHIASLVRQILDILKYLFAMTSAAACAEPGWYSRAVKSSSITNIGIIAGFLDRIPPEVRMEIYKLALPTGILFVEGWGSRSPLTDLLTTCKTINREASPIFYSSNNFRIGHWTLKCHLPTHALFKYTREVTFEWTSPTSTSANDDAIVMHLKAALLRDLHSYQSLESLHIRGFWFGGDPEYLNFRRNYQKEGVIPSYLEHTDLNALLVLSRIHEITLHHVGGVPATQTKDLEAMGKYMTKHLKDLKSGAFHVKNIYLLWISEC